MSRLVMEAAPLQKELCEARNEFKSGGGMLAALKEFGEKRTSTKREVPKLLSSVTKSQEYCPAENIQVGEQKLEI